MPANEQETITTILMILRDLGWDPFGEEVRQEFAVGGGRVDIALIALSRAVAFIEAKAPRENLSRHVEQVVKYAFHEGVDICALTNGSEWWLYLPMERVPFEQRRFAVLKIQQDRIEVLVDNFETFLGKESLLSRQAKKRAKRALQAQREAEYLTTELPKVWNQMLTGPDGELVELIGKRAYEKLSLRPAQERIAALLGGSPQPLMASDSSTPTPGEGLSRPTPEPTVTRKPIGVRIRGERCYIKHWKEGIDVVRRVAEVLYQLHGPDFERRLLAHRTSSGNPIASRNQDELRSPTRVGSTELFVETDLNTTQMLSRASFLLRLVHKEGSDIEMLYD